MSNDVYGATVILMAVAVAGRHQSLAPQSHTTRSGR